MARYAAFLRAVNLGATRKAPSKQLVAAFESAGFEDVATFRTSGNVAFTASGGGKGELTERIEAGLQEELGFEVPVFLRTEAEMESIAGERPFPARAVEGSKGKLQVALLLETPSVPVPRTYALCEDDAVIGTAFFIMEWVAGRVMADPLLPGLSPGDRRRVPNSMNDVLARLHTVDLQATGLTDYGASGSYFERQIHRWTTQYRASETERIEAMERLIAWLPEHMPVEDGPRSSTGTTDPAT